MEQPPALTHSQISSSFHAAMREAAWPWHQKVDRHPLLSLLLNPGLTERHYRQILKTLYWIHKPLHQLLQQLIEIEFPGQHYVLPDHSAWLVEDLEFFHEPTNEADPLTGWLDGHSPAADEAIGWLYVLEGSAKGSQIIGPRVRNILGLQGTQGTRFFSGMGADADSQWQSYWEFAGEVCLPEQQAIAASGAVKLFVLLSEQLDRAQIYWNLHNGKT